VSGAVELELALEAVRAAGAVIMTTFRSVGEVREKGPDQPVTAADLAADAVLADRLRGGTAGGWVAGSGPAWLSEETVDSGARLDRSRVWIVDPLDGTRSFIAGYPEFAVSVALAEAGQAVLGVVYNPAREDVFWAVRGAGAYRTRRWRGGTAGGRRLRMPAPGRRSRHRVLASRTEIRRGEFEVFTDWTVTPLGSTAYKLCMVAAGVGQAFVSRGPKSEWDVAAGGLILEEAGGAVTDLAGLRLRYNRPDPYVHGVVAAHPSLHGELLEVVARLPAPRLRGGAARGTRED
jgi:myo-inositol-1(or 4)-monophosphatase